ncbi:MAG: protein kinase [Euryarchaeota archaeon]|nr:protein kinase [Euryarchaeota archaeon]
MTQKERPMGVTILAVVYGIPAAVFALLAIGSLLFFGLISGLLPADYRSFANGLGVAATVLFAILAVPFYFIAAGLWKGRQWAQGIAILVAGLYAVGGLVDLGLEDIVVSTLPGALIIWYLLRPDVKAFFATAKNVTVALPAAESAANPPTTRPTNSAPPYALNAAVAAPAVAQTKSYRDRFKIERELGSGGFGKAMLAKDVVLDRKVVLKQPLTSWLAGGEKIKKRFLQEARLAARVHHPNVVSVYEVITDEEPPVLVMEYVQGGSLEDVLDARNRLTPEEASRLCVDVLAGLEQIHAAGIVHRDLKPANVLLTTNGVAKVTDFGIAQVEPEAGSATVTASTMALSGTVLYMSPEQARGDPVDTRTDIYAMGAILYRMLTGDHYVSLDGQSDFKARQTIQDALPRLPADGIPWQYEGVVRTALSKAAGDRFQTAAAMREALLTAQKA